MACEALIMGDSAEALAAELRALVPAPDSVSDAVAEIVDAVRLGGDAAVRGFTERFDTAGRPAPETRVGEGEMDDAAQALAPEIRAGLALALQNVSAVASAGLAPNRVELDLRGSQVTVREEPVRRAAVYVPGGRAPYPSTVVMGVAAARSAGVAEIVVSSPPGRSGEIDPVILAACRLTGVPEVYRMGGAQAIAALALGTEAVPVVDVIVGPGNLYVQEAKRQVSDRVGIDGFAGPSDLMVIAEDIGDVGEAVVLDLVAQAEHGAGTIVIGVSTSEAVLARLAEGASAAPESGAVCRMVRVPSLTHAGALAEAFAPEHLQLIGPGAEALAPRITRAGCVFVGASAGTAFGDYVAGSNHVLPTAGAARFASGLSAAHFRRRFNEVRITDPAALARAAAPVARAEGFELHARSMEARIRENRA